MTAAVATSNLQFANLLDRQVRSASNIVAKTQDTVPAIYRPVTPATDWGPAIYAALAEIERDCQRPNWDGQGTAVVSQDVIANTEAVAKALHAVLPLGTPAPDLVPESDGEISIDWIVDQRHIFSISVGDGDAISFAAQFGNEGAEHGWRRIDRTSPVTLKATLRELASLVSKVFGESVKHGSRG